jgi:hypothetical protein
MIYAVVVLMKLYISATTPGEIANVINEKDLRIEENIARLEAQFQRVVERDRLSPHTKFLYVIQRLGERFKNIKRRQQEKDKPQPSKLKQEQRRSPSNAPTRPRSDSRPSSASGVTQAQGLQLLSEVAVNNSATSTPSLLPSLQAHLVTNSAPAVPQINTSASNTPMVHSRHLPSSATSTPTTMSQQLPQAQPPQQANWYSHQPSPGDGMSAAMQGMDGQPMYDYNGQLTGLEAFDFGLGGLGMGMDGAITGLFLENGGIWGTNTVPEGFFTGWN